MSCYVQKRIREKFIAGKIHKLILWIAIDVCVLLNKLQQIHFFWRIIIPIAAAAVFQACNSELKILCVVGHRRSAIHTKQRGTNNWVFSLLHCPISQSLNFLLSHNQCRKCWCENQTMIKPRIGWNDYIKECTGISLQEMHLNKERHQAEKDTTSAELIWLQIPLERSVRIFQTILCESNSIFPEISRHPELPLIKTGYDRIIAQGFKILILNGDVHEKSFLEKPLGMRIFLTLSAWINRTPIPVAGQLIYLGFFSINSTVIACISSVSPICQKWKTPLYRYQVLSSAKNILNMFQCEPLCIDFNTEGLADSTPSLHSNNRLLSWCVTNTRHSLTRISHSHGNMSLRLMNLCTQCLHMISMESQGAVEEPDALIVIFFQEYFNFIDCMFSRRKCQLSTIHATCRTERTITGQPRELITENCWYMKKIKKRLYFFYRCGSRYGKAGYSDLDTLYIRVYWTIHLKFL